MRAERIKYPMGALTAEGALIYDENVSGRRPAVLVAPNWMGMTDKAIQRGELVAGNRYVVFVADMYGAGTRPADFGEAAALANPLRADAIEQRKRVRAAFETMIAQAKARNLIDGRRAAIAASVMIRCFCPTASNEPSAKCRARRNTDCRRAAKAYRIAPARS